MIKKTLFFLITDKYQTVFEQKNQNDRLPNIQGLQAEEFIACEQVVELWSNKKRIYIHCQDQQQAERVDECLWQMELDHFIPHNLVGEGLKNGSPIEIGWSERRGTGKRDVLINLQTAFPVFASVYWDVIDFVPFEEVKKNQARERYKSYRDIGFNLKTIPYEVKNSQ